MKISIVGLGKLGLPLAVSFAARGLDVIGVDLKKEIIDLVNSSDLLDLMGDQAHLICDHPGDLSAHSDIERAVLETEATIVMVATPSLPSGALSLEYVLPVCEEIGRAIQKKTEHLVIISSTVNPGDCEQIRDVLPGNTGFCYVPEFVALGEQIQGFIEPDFVLIGTEDEAIKERVRGIYRQLVANEAEIFFTSLVGAELAKMAANVLTVMKITFANQIGELCESVPGANAKMVMRAVTLDSRFSPKYLRPGTYAGGPCYPRDLKALSASAAKHHVDLQMVDVMDWVNEEQNARLAMLAYQEAPVGAQTVGILGLTYKPNVAVYEPSTGLALLKLLPQFFESVIAYDPLIVVGQSVRSAQVCVDRADVLVVTLPYQEFAELKYRKDQVVIDCWQFMDPEKVEAKYVGVGRYRE